MKAIKEMSVKEIKENPSQAHRRLVELLTKAYRVNASLPLALVAANLRLNR